MLISAVQKHDRLSCLIWVCTLTLLSSASAEAANPSPSPSPNCVIATPTPGPPYADFQNESVSNRMLVSGTAQAYPDDDDDNGLSTASVTTGESTPTLVPIPATSATPCPTPSINDVFKAEAVPSGKMALVTVWGTANAFNNAKFYILTPAMADSDNITLTNPVGISTTAPAGYPDSITPPSIPSGYVGGYFLLPAADQSKSAGQYNQVTYATSAVGDLFYRIDFDVVGTHSTHKTFHLNGGTAFKPLVKFSNAPITATAGNCSSKLTVLTTDGNGNQTDVMTGNSGVNNRSNAAQISLSATPAFIFLDSNCNYPISSVTIQNPVPAPPSGPAPAKIISSHLANFYLKSNTAEPLSVTANYIDSGDTIYDVVQNEVVNGQVAIAIKLSGPASVNQGDCSSAVTASLVDLYGNHSAPASNKTLSLTPSPGVTYYSDAACTMAITSLTFMAGQSDLTFYVRDTSSGVPNIGLSDSSPAGSALQSDSIQLHVAATGNSPQTSDPAVARQLARSLYLRLVGVPPLPNDPSLANMTSDILNGRILDAAHRATDLDGFYNVTIRNVATALSNLLFDPLVQLNDFTTTWIGIVRDGQDARNLLTGDQIYVPSSFASPDRTCAQAQNFIYDNSHKKINLGSTQSIYSDGRPLLAMDKNFINLRKDLVPVSQCVYNSTNSSALPVLLPDTAGVVTSRAFLGAHGFAGTNRRLIRKMFEVFMCKDITDIADNQMPDWHIRRDVDRAPGGSPTTYTANCRSCHAGMDALGGAFAYFDSYVPDGSNAPSQGNYSDTSLRTFFVNKAGIYTSDNCSGTAAANPKVNKNCSVFPAGYVTSDDSWVNFFIANHNAALGWDAATPLKGDGVNELGQMFANSAQFSSCMAQRAFTAMCKRAPASTDSALVSDLANDFQFSGYNMRRLFERAASLSTCLMNSGGN